MKKQNIFIIMSLLVFPFFVHAADADTVSLTNDLIKRANEIVASSDKSFQLNALCKLLTSNFDTEYMITKTVGAKLQKATPDLQKQFREVFTSYLANSYFGKLKLGITKIGKALPGNSNKDNNLTVVPVSTSDRSPAFFYYNENTSMPRLVDIGFSGVTLLTTMKSDIGNPSIDKLIPAMKNLSNNNLGMCPASSPSAAQNAATGSVKAAD